MTADALVEKALEKVRLMMHPQDEQTSRGCLTSAAVMLIVTHRHLLPRTVIV